MKDFAKEEMVMLIMQRAMIIEEFIELRRKSNGDLFVFGVDDEREFQLQNAGFDKAVEVLQPIVNYDPNWGMNTTSNKKIMCKFFWMECFGSQYKIFTLCDMEDEQ